MTKVAGVILAGGKSQRFGSPKAHAVLEQASLISHVAARLQPQVACLAIAGPHADLGYKCLDDGDYKGRGPIAGILAGLAWASSVDASHLVSAPCDTPFLPNNTVAILVRGILQNPHGEAPVVIEINGRRQNACALWPVSKFPDAISLVSADGVSALWEALQQLNAFTLDVTEDELDGSFFNVNTLADLQSIQVARSIRHG